MSSVTESQSGPQRTVLQIIPAMNSGGAEQGAFDVAVAAADAGWRSLVVSTGGRLADKLERLGVGFIPLPVAAKNPLTMAINALRLSKIIRNEGVDLLHVRSRAPAWSTYLAARMTKVPWITTFHGAYSDGNAAKHYYNSIMTKADRVIAISDFIAAHIKQNYQTAPEQLVTIPRGIDIGQFDADVIDAHRVDLLCRTWNLPEDRPVILLPGRLSRLKGQLLFLEALAQSGLQDAVALLVGDHQGRSDYQLELKAQIEELDLRGRVILTGDWPDMPVAYYLADLVVAPSTKPEAFGRVPVEAQSMGRPVIAANHGGAKETILDGETGWLVAPNDAAALAAAMRNAMALSGNEKSALAARARTHIRAKYDVETMCRSTLDVYSAVIDRSAAAATAVPSQTAHPAN